MPTMIERLSEQALEARARRGAQRAGCIAKKSRWRRDSIDNYGGFQLIDRYTNFVVADHASTSPRKR